MRTVIKPMSRRFGAAAAATAVFVIALAGSASAHVTVSADDSTKAAPDSILTFRVPNEQEAATTTKVTIKFPTKDPIASVMPAAAPGWVVTTTPVKFNPPIKTDDGTITDGVGQVVYTAARGTKGIPIGGFAAFQILVGPLPDADQVAFPVVQTYSNGQVSSWIEPVTDPANPPENPTPVLALHDATATDAGTAFGEPAAATTGAPAVDLSDYATKSDASTGRTIGLLGLIVGAVALVAAGFALGRGRKATKEPTPGT